MDNNNMYQQSNDNKPANNNKATASLVLGIISLVCIFFGYSTIVGIITGVIGLVLGIQAKKETPSGMATAGIVLSVIGLVLCALGFLACVACIGVFGSLGAFY